VVKFLTGGKNIIKYQLVPVEPPARQPQFGNAAGLVTIADDFDAPLEDLMANKLTGNKVRE
jgi:hypothetical protein